MSKIIVTGSIAYDQIMKFRGKFSENILPEQLNKLSVSFLVDDLEKHPGGTGQNAAYNLGILGMKKNTVLLGSVGKDFSADKKLKKYIKFKNIWKDKKLYTSQGNMVTDSENNQIATFHIGAMASADLQSLKNISGDKKFVLVYANDKNAMKKFLKESYELGIQSFFSPAQSLPIWEKDELLDAVKYANFLVCNEYEFELFKTKTGLSKEEILAQFNKVVITLGAEGAKVCDAKYEETISAVKLKSVIDPTGAGDAFLAALAFALNKEFERENAVKFANVVASFVVEQPGTMMHKPSKTDIKKRYLETYETELNF